MPPKVFNGLGDLPRDQRVRECRLFAFAAITLQSLNATYHVLSCTLNAVRALYVLETTFYDGFESHSLRQYLVDFYTLK